MAMVVSEIGLLVLAPSVNVVRVVRVRRAGVRRVERSILAIGYKVRV